MCEWATLETLIGHREHTMYWLIKEHPNHLAIGGITGVICVDGSHTWCFYANSIIPLNTSRRKRVPLRQISRSCVKFVRQTCALWLLLAAKKCRRCAGSPSKSETPTTPFLLCTQKETRSQNNKSNIQLRH